MKKNILILLILLLLINISIGQDIKKENYNSFNLTYIVSGLGSNMGSLMPTFRVVNNKYLYTYEQNSYWEKPDKENDTICFGYIRTNSLDSIINLVKDIKDTLIYKTELIMSGCYYVMKIRTDNINLTFELDNAFDSIVSEIINILNSNIPDDKRKLWFEDDK